MGVSERCGECDSDRYHHCCRTMDRAAGLEPAPGPIPGILVGPVLSASRKCSHRGLVYDIFQDTASIRPLNAEYHSGCTNYPSNHRNRGVAVSSGDVPVARTERSFSSNNHNRYSTSFRLCSPRTYLHRMPYRRDFLCAPKRLHDLDRCSARRNQTCDWILANTVAQPFLL